MTAIQSLEKKLADVFKGAPKLPENVKATLVRVWPYIALVAGLVQLFVALSFYNVTRLVVGPALDYEKGLFITTSGRTLGPQGFDRTLIYLAIFTLLVDAVIMLMAYPKLQQKSKKGWDLLFLAAVINVGYAVMALFLYSGGIPNFIASLIGSAAGFYLLFQVREKYSGGPRIASTSQEKK